MAGPEASRCRDVPASARPHRVGSCPERKRSFGEVLAHQITQLPQAGDLHVVASEIRGEGLILELWRVGVNHLHHPGRAGRRHPFVQTSAAPASSRTPQEHELPRRTDPGTLQERAESVVRRRIVRDSRRKRQWPNGTWPMRCGDCRGPRGLPGR